MKKLIIPYFLVFTLTFMTSLSLARPRCQDYCYNTMISSFNNATEWLYSTMETQLSTDIWGLAGAFASSLDIGFGSVFAVGSLFSLASDSENNLYGAQAAFNGWADSIGTGYWDCIGRCTGF